MSDKYESMTVVELRKTARELGIKLPAGSNKQTIIETIRQRTESADAPVQTAPGTQTPAGAEASAPGTQAAAPAVRRRVRTATIITDDEAEDSEDTPVLTVSSRPGMTRSVVHTPSPAGAEKPSTLSSISSKAPAFTLEGSRSWHNPRSYQPSTYSSSRTSQGGWNAPQRSFDRSQGDRSYRAGSYAPPVRQDNPYAPSRPQVSAPGVSRFGPDASGADTPSFGPDLRPAPQARPEGPVHREETGYPSQDAPRNDPGPSSAVSEMLATGECGDSAGILEIHPDGYGFLRTANLNPGKNDVYVSNAQIRRFNLRTGDHIAGKTRPQREGDRYSALLYITQVNGNPPEENTQRPSFESLTPIYPKKRIDLSARDPSCKLFRAIDLLCPIGFGQRSALMCPIGSGKTDFLVRLSDAVSSGYPEAKLMSLLIDERPEDVTEFQGRFKGEVMYSAMDSSPENHVHAAEMCLERCMRLVEQKNDVVLILDSLTRLCRALNSTAPSSARTLAGGLAAGCTAKARRLFGAARNTREGGSLTVIAVLYSPAVTPLDEAILDDFRGTANMVLTLLKPQASNPFTPAADLMRSETRKGELMLSEQEIAVAKMLREHLSGSDDPEAVLKEFFEDR